VKENLKAALDSCKAIQASVNSYGTVPDEGLPAYSQQVLPRSLTRGTRGYIEKVANQINGSYEKGWFDCCAVMIRRLIETLIIECYEHHKISSSIKGPSGDYLYLRDLISALVAESSWTISRNSKKSLGKLKDIGDKSAHSRRFNARRWDIDKIVDDLRVVTEELLYLASLR